MPNVDIIGILTARQADYEHMVTQFPRFMQALPKLARIPPRAH